MESSEDENVDYDDLSENEEKVCLESICHIDINKDSGKPDNMKLRFNDSLW